jgi:hypothetical protein
MKTRMKLREAVPAVFLLIGCSHAAFSQTDPLIGTWKLNLAKSTFDPGPPPRSGMMHYSAAGRHFRDILTGVDAQGRPTKSVFIMAYDGKFHRTTGVVGYDARAFTRVDDHTVTFIRTLAGKVVATGTRLLSEDGRTLTFNVAGGTGKAPPYNNTVVYEKQ